MRDDGFTHFVQARADYHRRLATLLAGDWHAGEDLLQASLVKLYQAWSRVDIATADAYLHRIMANTHRSWWRARWRHELPAAELPEVAGADFAAQHAGGAAVRAALAALPRQQRAVLVLRYWADLPEAEVADILGCTAGSVKTHAHRGIRALRQRLGQPDGSAPAYQGASDAREDSDDR
jgi:RNA polymerase sigma-70 factor (sigma-E family)